MRSGYIHPGGEGCSFSSGTHFRSMDRGGTPCCPVYISSVCLGNSTAAHYLYSTTFDNGQGVKAMKHATKDDTFQWSFIGVIILALLLIVLAVVGVIPLWVIAIAIIGG